MLAFFTIVRIYKQTKEELKGSGKQTDKVLIMLKEANKLVYRKIS